MNEREEQAALSQSLSVVRLLCLLVYNGKTGGSKKKKKKKKTCLFKNLPLKKEKTSLETKKNAVLNAPHEKLTALSLGTPTSVKEKKQSFSVNNKTPIY